jgi:hypothetical protein
MPVSGMHALGCPRGHCRLAACPGDRAFRSRSLSRSRIRGSNHFAFPSLADRIGSKQPVYAIRSSAQCRSKQMKTGLPSIARRQAPGGPEFDDGAKNRPSHALPMWF